MSNLQKRLNELFEYRDGSLYRKASVRGAKQGSKTGIVENNGYEYVIADGKKIRTHRAVFVMHHGHEPILVDHIDGVKTNNRIENLREVTKSQNGMNRKINLNNQSGAKNVCWSKYKNAWTVKLNVNKKRIHVGAFADFEFADLVAHEARVLYHGQYARHDKGAA